MRPLPQPLPRPLHDDIYYWSCLIPLMTLDYTVYAFMSDRALPTPAPFLAVRLAVMLMLG